MTIDKWIKSVLGKYVKYNKSTKGYQCVDLAKSYLVDCFKFFHCASSGFYFFFKFFFIVFLP